MSASATRFAHRPFIKSVGHVSTAALGLTRDDLVPVQADPLAPTLALSKPDMRGRMPVAWAEGQYVYDEVNVVCKIQLGPKRVRYERWIVA